jgi:hypothetical protein
MTGSLGDPFLAMTHYCLTAKDPDDAIDKKFDYVPPDVRREFRMKLYTRRGDFGERELLIRRFAAAAEGYWYEERQRAESVLRRIGRLFG